MWTLDIEFELGWGRRGGGGGGGREQGIRRNVSGGGGSDGNSLEESGWGDSWSTWDVIYDALKVVNSILLENSACKGRLFKKEAYHTGLDESF